MRMQFWCSNVLPFVHNIGPASFRRFIIDILPWKNAHKLRDMIDYMYNLGSEILESKKAALEKGDEAVDQQVGRGKDLISVLRETVLSTISFCLVLNVLQWMKTWKHQQKIDWRTVKSSLR